MGRGRERHSLPLYYQACPSSQDWVLEVQGAGQIGSCQADEAGPCCAEFEVSMGHMHRNIQKAVGEMAMVRGRGLGSLAGKRSSFKGAWRTWVTEPKEGQVYKRKGCSTS